MTPREDCEKEYVEMSVRECDAGLYVADGWTVTGETVTGLDGPRVMVRRRFRVQKGG